MSVDEKYPEHVKLAAIAEKSQTCGDFLQWLVDTKKLVLAETHVHSAECTLQGFNVCGLHQRELIHTQMRVTTLLAEFFEIDEAKVAAEKDAMLEELRAQQQGLR